MAGNILSSPSIASAILSDSSELPPTAPASTIDALESETSWSDSDNDERTAAKPNILACDLKKAVSEAFDENILAKALRVATRSLINARSFSGPRQSPSGFPETVPQQGPNYGRYEYREPDFWTCGFFPGELWALRERLTRHPQHVHVTEATRKRLHHDLSLYCDIWTEPLHAMADRTDTHDIGFIIMPALRREWELTSWPRSLDTIIRAAHSLATRYIPSAGVIRSWDILLKKEITVTDMTENALIIIDSLCNLDLLYYASAHGGSAEAQLADIATTHARTVMRSHLRPESVTSLDKHGYRGQLYSTCHVANIDPANGDLKWRWTAQGFANESTWSRGQSWAVLGYAQTYYWTKDPTFLEVACGVAEYFLYRLETAPSYVEVTHVDEATGTSRTVGRYVPLWDFDAPVGDDGITPPPRDTSAGLIAANGLLLLSQALVAHGDYNMSRRFLEASIRIVQDTLDLSLAEEKARFSTKLSSTGELDVEDVISGKTFDAVLKNGTANNNEHARRRLADHGLIYSDYYLVEWGNRVAEMGLV